MVSHRFGTCRRRRPLFLANRGVARRLQNGPRAGAQLSGAGGCEALVEGSHVGLRLATRSPVADAVEVGLSPVACERAPCPSNPLSFADSAPEGIFFVSFRRRWRVRRPEPHSVALGCGVMCRHRREQPTSGSPRSERPLARVLVLCTGNSCRSQMAEGFLRARGSDLVEVASAGSDPAGYVHPLAIEVMAELGIDLGDHHSKSLEEFSSAHVDVVVTVCDAADANCPVFPGRVERLHWSFPDPAAARGDVEEVKRAFVAVRDAIEARIERFLEQRRNDSPDTASL